MPNKPANFCTLNKKQVTLKEIITFKFNLYTIFMMKVEFMFFLFSQVGKYIPTAGNIKYFEIANSELRGTKKIQKYTSKQTLETIEMSVGRLS